MKIKAPKGPGPIATKGGPPQAPAMQPAKLPMKSKKIMPPKGKGCYK